MINLGLSLLLLVSSFNCLSGIANSAPASNPNATTFIRASCRATRYPDVCVKCLSVYATKIQQDEQQLARAALDVSLAMARSTTVFVSKLAKVRGITPIEYQAVKDCTMNMGDTVNQLTRSISEISGVGRGVAGRDFMWHVSNVQTWVSAALSNLNICLDGFSRPNMDGNVKVAMNRRVFYVSQVTSNALALIDRFAARHRAAGSSKKPQKLVP